jgi:hypothetical protein
MIDLNQILAGMVSAIRSSDFPNSSEIASALRLDLSTATITTAGDGAMAIMGARLLTLSTAEIGLACASTPRKRLDCVFSNSSIPVGPYVEMAARDGRRVARSKRSKGLTIAFRIDGFDCGITASAPNGVAGTLFCAAQSAAKTERARRSVTLGEEQRK